MALQSSPPSAEGLFHDQLRRAGCLPREMRAAHTGLDIGQQMRSQEEHSVWLALLYSLYVFFCTMQVGETSLQQSSREGMIWPTLGETRIYSESRGDKITPLRYPEGRKEQARLGGVEGMSFR